MSRVARALLVSALAAGAFAQESGGPVPSEATESQVRFFDWVMVPLVVVPLIVMVWLARRRSRSRPSQLPVWDDESFEEEVLGARTPVLAHFSDPWNVANRAALSQTELLAYMNRGAVTVGYLDVSASPRLMERFPDFVAPSYLLFYDGRRLFHRPGLWQADDLQEHIDRALAREGF